MKSRGYFTAGIGKWHLGLGDREKTDYDRPLRPGPLEAGFDYYFGIPASLDMDPYLYFENDKPVEKASGTIAEKREHRGAFWRAGAIAPGFKHEEVLPTLAKRASEWIRDHARRAPRQPFFLYLPLASPHTPWLASAKFQGKSQAGHYGDFVAMTDDAVGQVLAALKLADRVSVNLEAVDGERLACIAPEKSFETDLLRLLLALCGRDAPHNHLCAKAPDGLHFRPDCILGDDHHSFQAEHPRRSCDPLTVVAGRVRHNPGEFPP